MLQARLDLDSVLGTAGGPSSMVLIVPHSSATVSNTDADYIYSRLRELRQTVPGTRLRNLTYYTGCIEISFPSLTVEQELINK